MSETSSFRESCEKMFVNTMKQIVGEVCNYICDNYKELDFKNKEEFQKKIFTALDMTKTTRLKATSSTTSKAKSEGETPDDKVKWVDKDVYYNELMF